MQRYIEYHEDLFTNPETWELFAHSVREISEDVKAHNAQFSVVLFPLFDFPLNAQYPFMSIHKKVVTLCEELSIPYLDLFSAFQGLDEKRLQLIPGADSHPNEIAHRIAAEHIYTWMVDRHLVPEPASIIKMYQMRRGLKEKSIKSDTLKRHP